MGTPCLHPLPPTPPSTWGCSSVLQSAACARVGGVGGGENRMVSKCCRPPAPIPPSPAQFVPSPCNSMGQCVGGHSAMPPPPHPSHVARADAVIPTGLPQPPVGCSGVGVCIALRGGCEGGAQRGVLQRHFLQELIKLRGRGQLCAGRQPEEAVMGKGSLGLTPPPHCALPPPKHLPPRGALQCCVDGFEGAELWHLLISGFRGGTPGYQLVGTLHPGGTFPRQKLVG